MTCASCGQDFQARTGARTCSTRCRVQAHRQAKRSRKVPVEMTSRDCWVTHRRKVPLTVHGRPASSTNPDTWSDFVSATQAAQDLQLDGVGFVLDGCGIAAIDLDDCLHDGILEPWAANIVADCPGTYVEVSPSGRGLHIFGLATVGRGRRLGQVEVYDRGRYMTVTGQVWEDRPIRLTDFSQAVSSLLLGERIEPAACRCC